MKNYQFKKPHMPPTRRQSYDTSRIGSIRVSSSGIRYCYALSKVHENAVFQRDSTETGAVIEQYNELSLMLDCRNNTSRNKLTKCLDIQAGRSNNRQSWN